MVRLDCQARNVEFNHSGGLQSLREKPYPYAASPLGRYLRLVRGGGLLERNFGLGWYDLLSPLFYLKK